jgi:methylated-DNA-[protein]-cysteine S-methyltransferase
MHTVFTGYYNSPLGNLQITCEADAVSAITFTDKEAGVSDAHPLIDKTIAQLDAYFKGTLISFDLPLNPSGTPFQVTVWNELLHISFGKTFSYLQVSRNLGDEKAIRAVGNANGRNPIAIVIPCHRVIGSDGSLVGYAGKLWRKKWLLDHEKQIISRQTALQF